VGIVVDSPSSEPSESAFMEGFQIAVDQSPDVSHPEGIEGGDHLGSMDVVFVVINGASTEVELLEDVAELLDRDAMAIIVTDVSPDALQTLLGPITEAGVMLISTADDAGSGILATTLFFDAAAVDTARALLTDRVPTFEDEYAAIYERPAPPAAARGYIAGRLVDIAVEATDRDPFDVQTLAEALAAAGTPPSPEAEVVGADADTAAPTPQGPGTSLLQPDAQGTPAWVVGAVAIAVAVLLIGAAGLIRRARSRPVT